MKPRLPRQQVVSKEHTDEQVKRLFDIIEVAFASNLDRVKKLHTMYTDLMPLLRYAPASAKVQYHNAYEGGYLDHILHVIDTARDVKKLFENINGVPDCSHAEIVFAAMHHDLGKLGDEDGPVYVPETEEFWNKKGSYFEYHDLRQKMTVYDRTIFMLQSYDIKFTKNEMVGIRMADGVFDPSNKAYYEAPAPFPHKTNIGYIIHWADWMSTIAEKDVMRKQFELLNATE